MLMSILYITMLKYVHLQLSVAGSYCFFFFYYIYLPFRCTFFFLQLFLFFILLYFLFFSLCGYHTSCDLGLSSSLKTVLMWFAMYLLNGLK